MTMNKVQMQRNVSHSQANLTRMNAAASLQKKEDKKDGKDTNQTTKQVAEAEDTRSATLIKFQRTMRRLMILRGFATKLGLAFHID